MSSERRDRFLKLERARPGRDDAPDPVPASSTDRFRPPPERPLETADERKGAQPFIRCFSCQMDNTIYAATCQNCAAELDTPAQRAFNEKLWAERQAQAEAERREIAERERVRQSEAAGLFTKDTGFPDVGLFYDIDYWTRPDHSMNLHDLTKLLTAFAVAAWDRHERVVKLIAGE